MPMTKQQQLQRIVREYQRADTPWPATTRDIAAWAIKTERWKEPPKAAEQRCAREIGKAMREEYHTDSKGRRVRTKHTVKRRDGSGQYVFMWDDLRTAPRRHMEIAFQQRRERIVGECHQLKNDVDSYNDANPDEPAIQLSFNFTRDLEELEALRTLEAA